MSRLDVLVVCLHFSSVMSLSTSQRNFGIVNDPQINILPLGNIHWRPQSITACAVACVDLSPHCYSFLYDVDGQECKPGRGTVATNTSRTPTQLMFVISSCDANINYLLESNDLGYICYWFSREAQQYDTAVKSCQARGLKLVSLKTIDRVTLFMQLSARYLDIGAWIGLDDRTVEDQFRWVEDHSVLNSSLKSFLFRGGEPNDFRNNEDCVYYKGPIDFFNDDECSNKRPFVCQVT